MSLVRFRVQLEFFFSIKFGSTGWFFALDRAISITIDKLWFLRSIKYNFCDRHKKFLFQLSEKSIFSLQLNFICVTFVLLCARSIEVCSTTENGKRKFRTKNGDRVNRLSVATCFSLARIPGVPPWSNRKPLRLQTNKRQTISRFVYRHNKTEIKNADTTKVPRYSRPTDIREDFERCIFLSRTRNVVDFVKFFRCSSLQNRGSLNLLLPYGTRLCDWMSGGFVWPKRLGHTVARARTHATVWAGCKVSACGSRCRTTRYLRRQTLLFLSFSRPFSCILRQFFRIHGGIQLD